MTVNFMKSAGVQEVKTRLVKARAMQFVYQQDREGTIRHVQLITNLLDVNISCGYDQGATFYHLEMDRFSRPILRDRDWIVRDCFGKLYLLSDQEFNVYYEPGE